MPRAKASLLVILTSALTVAVLFLLPYTPALRVQTAVAVRGDLLRSVLLSGTVGYLDQQPCVNAQAGRVARVYARPGQKVRSGELLFAMDTSAQEEALAALEQARYAQRAALEGQGGAVTALAVERELAWQEQETTLRQAIELSQVRAGMDGVVEAVYAREGEWLDAAGVLGAVRGESRCVTATARLAALPLVQPGAPAALGEMGPAALSRMDAPDVQSGTQRLVFTPAGEEQLADCEIGETVTVEMLVETARDCVLVPLSAVASDGRVWYAEDGKARSAVPESVKIGGEMAAVGEEWEGRRVILLPESLRLTEGCAVKEAKAE